MSENFMSKSNVTVAFTAVGTLAAISPPVGAVAAIGLGAQLGYLWYRSQTEGQGLDKT
jgi:hypothetical protein